METEARRRGRAYALRGPLPVATDRQARPEGSSGRASRPRPARALPAAADLPHDHPRGAGGEGGDKDVQVQFALAFSMPVFITPPGAKSQVDCTVERAAADAIRANCENAGSAYAQMREISLSSPSGEKLVSRDLGLYILPAVKRSIEIKRPEGPIPAGKATLAVVLDDGSTRTFDVTVAE